MVTISPDPPTFSTQLIWAGDRPQKAAARALRERLIEQAAPAPRRAIRRRG